MGMRKQWERQWLTISRNCFATPLQKGPASPQQDQEKECTVQTSHSDHAGRKRQRHNRKTDRERSTFPTREPPPPRWPPGSSAAAEASTAHTTTGRPVAGSQQLFTQRSEPSRTKPRSALLKKKLSIDRLTKANAKARALGRMNTIPPNQKRDGTVSKDTGRFVVKLTQTLNA